jgi:hypothetical protein
LHLTLYKGLRKLELDWTPDITLEEYKSGYTLWCVDLTKDQEARTDKFHLIQTGNLRVEVQFAANVATTLNGVVYAVFDNKRVVGGRPENGCFYSDTAISASQSSLGWDAAISASQSSTGRNSGTGGGSGVVAFFFFFFFVFFLGQSRPGVGSWKYM